TKVWGELFDRCFAGKGQRPHSAVFPPSTQHLRNRQGIGPAPMACSVPPIAGLWLLNHHLGGLWRGTTHREKQSRAEPRGKSPLARLRAACPESKAAEGGSGFSRWRK